MPTSLNLTRNPEHEKMTDTIPTTGSKKHPAKRFQIPADIRALGNYATAITQAMRSEYHARMTGAAKRRVSEK